MSAHPNETFFEEATRISTKISKAIDGEDAFPAFYALTALAVHAAYEGGISREAATQLFAKMFDDGR